MTQATANPQTIESTPPPPPRAVTPTASRRAWMEPRVRIWWLAGSVFLVVALAWTSRQYLAWNEQASLVRDGQRIDATIWQTQDWGAGKPIPSRRIQAGVDAMLVWTIDGQQYTGRASFPDHVLSGATAPVWVDRDDPSEWTAKGTVTPLSRELVVLFVLAPAVMLSALIAVVARHCTLRLWKTGEAQRAVVVDVGRSAFAPLSRQVRCSLLDVADKRLLTVSIPSARGVPQRGETFYIMTPGPRASRAIAARAFSEV